MVSGIAAAVDHLDAIVKAAQTGVGYLRRSRAAEPGLARRALGVLDLIEPATAAALVARLGTTYPEIREAVLAAPVPASPADLSDEALAAACRRAGWLLGTPDEHADRVVIAAAFRSRATDVSARRVAGGHPDAVANAAWTSAAFLGGRLTAPNGLSDPIDHRLAEHSRHALRLLTGTRIGPPLTRIEAIAARFPTDLFHAGGITATARPPTARVPDDPGIGPGL